ncbi:hypothetical protein RM407_000198 [Enterobacter kobei]|nr:hypothetical protein [Enterobacter kobei]
MKLIDILVQELPKRGGWPVDAFYAMQDSDGLVKFSKSKEKIYHDYNDGHEWCSEGGYDWIRNDKPFEGNLRIQVSQDNVTAFISRERYEAALAASKPEWDGVGLPPVGCECERSWCGDKWLPCTVLFVSDETIVVKLATREAAYGRCEVVFRPIRSEEDKKRDESAKGLIEYLDKETDIDNVFSIQDVIGFYDAIAAGKIPHIRID